MPDDSSRNDAIADVINLLAAPIAGSLRTLEQYRRSVDELFRAIDNLNSTMENLNETASRINVLLAEVEEPIKVMMPQITRSVQTADQITQALEAPIKAAAPNIERIADTLSSPGFAALPGQLDGFMSAMGDISKRLGPLTQFAENAGGLFGGLRLPGMPGASAARPTGDDDTSTGADTAPSDPPRKKAAAKKPAKKAAKKSAG